MPDITELLEQIRLQYIAELPTRIENIESLILKLEKSDAFKDNFEEIYRAAHSLKGSAGTHNLHILTTIAHHFENMLTPIGSQDTISESQTNLLLGYVDLLNLATEQLSANQTDFSAIEGKLSTLQPGKSDKSTRVMMVEQSRVITNIVQQVFLDHSIEIELCADGYEALKILLLEDYDLVIINAEAPMLNGHALISALNNSSDSKSHTYSILLTSNEGNTQNKRSSDPDFTVQKNNQFIHVFPKIASQAIESIQQAQQS